MENFMHFPVKDISVVATHLKLHHALPSGGSLRIECGRAFRLVLGDTPELIPDRSQMPVDVKIAIEKECGFLSGGMGS